MFLLLLACTPKDAAPLASDPTASTGGASGGTTGSTGATSTGDGTTFYDLSVEVTDIATVLRVRWSTEAST